MSAIISIENVSKAYRLGQIGGGTLKGDFASWCAKLCGKPDPFLKIGEEHHARHMGEKFWALDDVSFEVNEGEVVGIIGRNGAGKSTLLKILSQVTTPTSGHVKIKGRIASLLEVGTGFHPELTGRENVFLNGAILGMTKDEIHKKFDEIVAFSEIEEFIDTPVKRYSSGMYVRLAFAVAAHLESEILIVDEVLAVGDAQFQSKCIGKMQDVRKHGRTVLFVSHNMNAVTALCSKAIVLKQGSVAYKGNIREAISEYGASTQVSGAIHISPKDSGSVLKSVTISQGGKQTNGLLEPLGDVTLSFEVVSPRVLKRARIGAAFTNSKGDRVFAVATWLGPKPLPEICGNQNVHIRFAMPPLVPGRYTLDIGFYEHDQKIGEDYYSAGAVEVSEINYLQTLEPTVAEIGQLFVRSIHFVT
jgi:lipopolysaccharide transport system ATP-binding protein